MSEKTPHPEARMDDVEVEIRVPREREDVAFRILELAGDPPAWKTTTEPGLIVAGTTRIVRLNRKQALDVWSGNEADVDEDRNELVDGAEDRPGGFDPATGGPAGE